MKILYKKALAIDTPTIAVRVMNFMSRKAKIGIFAAFYDKFISKLAITLTLQFLWAK